MIVPMHPFQSGHLHGRTTFPRPQMMDHFHFVEPVDGLPGHCRSCPRRFRQRQQCPHQPVVPYATDKPGTYLPRRPVCLGGRPRQQYTPAEETPRAHLLAPAKLSHAQPARRLPPNHPAQSIPLLTLRFLPVSAAMSRPQIRICKRFTPARPDPEKYSAQLAVTSV